ncbi:MAG: GNAT family N-acetyltransferase [Alphaproteobacteria bacterium]|nr:GNAT family N-acetyltransferase [Alphaproteobacteria bacterium]
MKKTVAQFSVDLVPTNQVVGYVQNLSELAQSALLSLSEKSWPSGTEFGELFWTPQQIGLVADSMTPTYLGSSLKKDRAIWVVSVGDNLAGFLAMSTKRSDPILPYLFVSPHHQGNGLGRCLLKTAEDFARTNRFSEIYLDAIPQTACFYTQRRYRSQKNAVQATGYKCKKPIYLIGLEKSL